MENEKIYLNKIIDLEKKINNLLNQVKKEKNFEELETILIEIKSHLIKLEKFSLDEIFTENNLEKNIKLFDKNILILNSLDNLEDFEEIVDIIKYLYKNLFNYILEKKDEINSLLVEKEKSIKEQELRELNRKKIENAIEKLNKNSFHLSNHKKYLENLRKVYNRVSFLLFSIGFLIYITLICFIGKDLSSFFKYDISVFNYLIIVMLLFLPIVLGLVFIMQSNRKTNEIHFLNRRFVLIEEINKSLTALVEIIDVKELTNKTESIINKLIDNILVFSLEKEREIQNKNMFNSDKEISNIFNYIKKNFDIEKDSI